MKILLAPLFLALFTMAAFAQPEPGGNGRGGGLSSNQVYAIIIANLGTGGVSAVVATNIADYIAKQTLISSNRNWVTSINGTATNFTARASSATAVASTLHPFIGGTADWMQWYATNGVKSSYINSNGAWFIGLDMTLNNGLNVSGSSVFNEATFSAAALFNSTAQFEDDIDINADVDISNGLTVGGLAGLTDVNITGALNITGVNSNAIAGVVSLFAKMSDGSVVETSIPTGGGGSGTGIFTGLTNNQETLFGGPIIRSIQKVAGATLPVGVTGTNSYSIATNASTAFTFSGTPRHGQIVSLNWSNWSESVQFLTNSTGIFYTRYGSNVTLFAMAGASVGRLSFLYDTNFVGGGRWMTIEDIGPEMELAAAGGTSLHTNAAGTLITISNSASGGSFSYDIDTFGITTNFATLWTLSTNALPTNVMALVTVRATGGGATNYASYHQSYTFQRITSGTVVFRGSNDLATPVESLAILNFYMRTNGNNIEAVANGQTNEPMRWHVQGTILYVTNDGPYVASGGASPDWIDVETFAGSDSDEATSQNAVQIQEVTLGAGAVSKFRIYSDSTFFNFNVDFKAALYTTGNALVGSAGDYGSVTVTAGGQYFEITFATPQTVTAGTYRIAWCNSVSGGVTMRLNNDSGGVSGISFDHTYAAFPVANITGLTLDDHKYVVSVFAVAP